MKTQKKQILNQDKVLGLITHITRTNIYFTNVLLYSCVHQTVMSPPMTFYKINCPLAEVRWGEGRRDQALCIIICEFIKLKIYNSHTILCLDRSSSFNQANWTKHARAKSFVRIL